MFEGTYLVRAHKSGYGTRGISVTINNADKVNNEFPINDNTLATINTTSIIASPIYTLVFYHILKRKKEKW